MEKIGKWEQNTVMDSHSFWIPVEDKVSKVFAEIYVTHFGGKESYEIRFFDSRVPRVHVSFLRSLERAKETVEEQYQKVQSVKEVVSYRINDVLKRDLTQIIYDSGISGDMGISDEDIADYLLMQLDALRYTLREKE